MAGDMKDIREVVAESVYGEEMRLIGVYHSKNKMGNEVEWLKDDLGISHKRAEKALEVWSRLFWRKHGVE